MQPPSSEVLAVMGALVARGCPARQVLAAYATLDSTGNAQAALAAYDAAAPLPAVYEDLLLAVQQAGAAAAVRGRHGARAV